MGKSVDMSAFKFQVGETVKLDSGVRLSGTIIARGKYPVCAKQRFFTPGDRYYLVDGHDDRRVHVVIEGYLEKTK